MSRPDFKSRRPGDGAGGSDPLAPTDDNAAIRAMARSVAEGTRFDRPAPGAESGAPVPPDRPPPEPAKKATFDFPLSLHKALQLAAVEKGVTMRHILLQALADAGYPVSPADLVPDRRAGR